MNIAEILKQAQSNTESIRQKLLEEADARYQRRREELQREYAAECQMIDDAFGIVVTITATV